MSGYSEGGASIVKKSLKSWIPQHLSAKSDIDRNLTLLRNRAHDLATNNPVGAAVIQTLTTGTIGSGLKLFPRINPDVVGLTPEQARLWARHVKQEFALWANNPNACDFLKRNSFYEMQALAFRNALTDGDSFVLFKRKMPAHLTPYTLRLQILDGQRVCNPIQGVGDQTEMLFGENKIIRGIEVDKSGALVAIHVANRLWNEPDLLKPDLIWQRVLWFGEGGTCNLLHICKDQAPDQFRGVPVLAPVLESLKQLARYSDAELSSSIIRSFFSIFFTQQQSNYDLNQITGDDYDAKDFKLGSPSVTSLPRGVDVKSVDSARQQSTFADFTDAFLKSICAAVNLPMEVVLKTFNASYSASRAAMLQANEEFRQRRAAFVTDFCAPVYEQFLTEAIAVGRVKAEGFFDDALKRQAWLAAEWFAESTKTLDPLKEVNAMAARLANGLSTYRKELAESAGLDFDDVIETLKQERALLS